MTADREPDAPAHHGSAQPGTRDADAAVPGSPADVMGWRKAERKRLIERRVAMRTVDRKMLSRRIAEELDRLAADVSDAVVSAYWPFRGEPELLGWMKGVGRRGGLAALPVVVAKGRPLEFRAWRPGAKLERGVWNIPVPADGETVTPDIVIAPVVGYDAACYRLGYGGGYFDRTLAALARRPRVFGVGYAFQAIPTIHPQPHDIPMDLIVTEDGTVRPPPDG